MGDSGDSLFEDLGDFLGGSGGTSEANSPSFQSEFLFDRLENGLGTSWGRVGPALLDDGASHAPFTVSSLTSLSASTHSLTTQSSPRHSESSSNLSESLANIQHHSPDTGHRPPPTLVWKSRDQPSAPQPPPLLWKSRELPNAPQPPSQPAPISTAPFAFSDKPSSPLEELNSDFVVPFPNRDELLPFNNNDEPPSHSQGADLGANKTKKLMLRSSASEGSLPTTENKPKEPLPQPEWKKKPELAAGVKRKAQASPAMQWRVITQGKAVDSPEMANRSVATGSPSGAWRRVHAVNAKHEVIVAEAINGASPVVASLTPKSRARKLADQQKVKTAARPGGPLLNSHNSSPLLGQRTVAQAVPASSTSTKTIAVSINHLGDMDKKGIGLGAARAMMVPAHVGAGVVPVKATVIASPASRARKLGLSVLNTQGVDQATTATIVRHSPVPKQRRFVASPAHLPRSLSTEAIVRRASPIAVASSP